MPKSFYGFSLAIFLTILPTILYGRYCLKGKPHPIKKSNQCPLKPGVVFSCATGTDRSCFPLAFYLVFKQFFQGC